MKLKKKIISLALSSLLILTNAKFINATNNENSDKDTIEQSKLEPMILKEQMENLELQRSTYNEKEPNNSKDTATIIGLNSMCYGTTESYNSDYFKFTIPSDGYVDLNFNRNQNERFDVALYDVNLNELKSISTTHEAGYKEVRMGIPKGTYYVRVEKYSYSDPDTQYSFSVNHTSTNTFEKEFNNSASKANNINLNTTYYGMTESYNSDYFKFTTSSDGYVDLNFNRNQNERFDVALYDVNLNELKSISTTHEAGYKEVKMGIPKGTYYVKVEKYSYSNPDTQYSFSVNHTSTNTFEKEFNNSASKANNINLNTTYYGMTESNNSDYFKFTTPSDGCVDLNFNRDQNKRFDVALYDVNLNELKYISTTYGTGYETISTNLSSGTYYVKINKYSSSDSDTQYNFMVTNNNLTDINNHWAKSTIIDFVNKGYVGGYSDNTFKPDNSITRAEFVSIFNKVFGLTRTSGKVFNDTRSHWSKTLIDIAVTNGVCNGKTSTEFKPDDPITREEAAVMISNYKKIADNNLDKLNKFKDEGQVSSWARSSVEGVIEKGYMGGYSDNTYRPTSKITRAEAVVTLSRIK